MFSYPRGIGGFKLRNFKFNLEKKNEMAVGKNSDRENGRLSPFGIKTVRFGRRI